MYTNRIAILHILCPWSFETAPLDAVFATKISIGFVPGNFPGP